MGRYIDVFHIRIGGCYTSQFFSVARRFKSYRQAFPINYFSSTKLTFLPFKLEPLGFSLNGQLRVAS